MNPLRVLLVDDEEEFVSTVRERLALRDISADGVLNGTDALIFLRQNPYDVVVLDVRMPGMDGLKLLKEIRKNHPGVQVILLTGRGSAKESEIGLREGAFDYLIKPVNIEELIKKMREAANR